MAPGMSNLNDIFAAKINNYIEDMLIKRYSLGVFSIYPDPPIVQFKLHSLASFVIMFSHLNS